MKTIDVASAKTSELVTFYNSHSDKPVKKFSDRKTAERRVNDLLDELYDGPEVFGVDDTPAPTAPAAPTKAADRSEGIRRSWQDPEVAAKRAQRSAVAVDGHEYKSVGAAFRALELPMNECIRFRIELKAQGRISDRYGHDWKIIPLNHEL